MVEANRLLSYPCISRCISSRNGSMVLVVQHVEHTERFAVWPERGCILISPVSVLPSNAHESDHHIQVEQDQRRRRKHVFSGTMSSVIPRGSDNTAPRPGLGYKRFVSTVAYPPDGHVITSSWDGFLTVWNLIIRE